VRALACRLLIVYAFCTPLFSLANSAYFILRSGGKTLITFMFDSGFTWVICIPIAWCLIHLTAMPIIWVYLCIQLLDIIKCTFGYTLVYKGVWINNMVA
jgi:Na+-driven multidrug efflux pump